MSIAVRAWWLPFPLQHSRPQPLHLAGARMLLQGLPPQLLSVHLGCASPCWPCRGWPPLILGPWVDALGLGERAGQSCLPLLASSSLRGRQRCLTAPLSGAPSSSMPPGGWQSASGTASDRFPSGARMRRWTRWSSSLTAPRRQWRHARMQRTRSASMCQPRAHSQQLASPCAWALRGFCAHIPASSYTRCQRSSE